LGLVWLVVVLDSFQVVVVKKPLLLPPLPRLRLSKLPLLCRDNPLHPPLLGLPFRPRL
jgi:hypothetical protein